MCEVNWGEPRTLREATIEMVKTAMLEVGESQKCIEHFKAVFVSRVNEQLKFKIKFYDEESEKLRHICEITINVEFNCENDNLLSFDESEMGEDLGIFTVNIDAGLSPAGLLWLKDEITNDMNTQARWVESELDFEQYVNNPRYMPVNFDAIGYRG